MKKLFYRATMSGGLLPEYVDLPVYNVRELKPEYFINYPVYLDCLKKDFIQVEVNNLGGLSWINIERRDLIVKEVI